MPPAAEPPEWAIVIGGSAGALDPLHQILSQLDRDASIAVFVVQHTSPDRSSHLWSVLARVSALPVVMLGRATEPIRPGFVYVASPDRHLKITEAGVQLTREVREHHTRPAVDVLFRSAARVFGARAIAVILSGYGGDGSSGSTAIHIRGGIVVVQSPDEAEVPSMPRRAISTGHVDYTVKAAQIGDLLRGLINGDVRREAPSPVESTDDPTTRMIASDIQEQEDGGRSGETSTVVCPDCGGVLWQTQSGRVVDFACHTGHRWSSDMLLVQKTEDLEAALLTALRLLKEKSMLLHQTASRARANGHLRAADRILEQASLDDRYATIIQKELLEEDRSPLTDVELQEEADVRASEPPTSAD
jgi:two-component system chemotaxis response regulator CheB